MRKMRPRKSVGSSPNKLVVGLRSAGSLTTHYFEDIVIELKVDNVSGKSLLIESVTLKFDPDTGATPVYVDCPVGVRLTANGGSVIKVTVCPTPLFREYTSQFVARFKCHHESRGRIIASFMESHDGLYIIIHPPEKQLGDVFVSFKQPEDRKLANILERYAKRAGFTPHLFIQDAHLGTDQWIRIDALIKGSHSAFIVWALRTDWGDGVTTEIELCRKHKVREILLIEEGVELPDAYRGTNRAYQKFDPADPASAISKAVSSVYAQVTNSKL